jgi:hypothetical protein
MPARYVAGVTSDDEGLLAEILVSATGQVPVVGAVAQPLATRLLRAVRAERRRNASIAMSAAERVSGKTREDIAAAIAANPRLVPLALRLMHECGVTGAEESLLAMGTVFGTAVGDPERISESEIVLTALRELRPEHMQLLKMLMTEPRRQPAGEPRPVRERPRWNASAVEEQSSLPAPLTDICLAGLIGAGLVRSLSVFGGTAYEATELAYTVVSVLRDLQDELRS